MPLSKPQPGQASIPSTSVHFIGPTKPILKPSPAQTPVRVASPTPESAGGKHAHFPPPGQEPTARYSGVDYDRSPIVVLPNICALPERGCPGKTYFQDERANRVPPAASSSMTNHATRGGDHAHPTKLLKKPHRSSPPPLATVPSSVPPALTHSDTTSSDDYDSDETYPHPIFPLSEPEAVFSVRSEHERARKTSGSSEITVVPTSRHIQGRIDVGLGKGRRARNPTNESSEDDCLGGF